MKVEPQHQLALLELAELDLNIAIASKSKRDIASSTEIEVARERLLAISDELIDARNSLGDLELALKCSENDLELVEKRLTQDQSRLLNAQNQKDAEGLQHEIETLKRRRSDLEEVEINILEDLEHATKTVEAILSRKHLAENELKKAEADNNEKEKAVEAKLIELASKREQLAAKLSPELVSLYQRKADRGVAVAKLVGRECGACRLSITASVFDEINSLPTDELAECPSCQAYLVRS